MSGTGNGTKANGILLADYSPDDAYLIQYAFNKLGSQNELKVVRDGGEVINYLNRATHNSDESQVRIPDVLLLDLNLPLIDGLDVLRWIRTQSRLKELPVIILTDCDFLEDVDTAYRLGAHSFFVKTPHFKDAVRLCLSLQQYRQDVDAGKDTKMPERVWPGRRALRVFPEKQSEQPCFPVAT